MSNKAWECPRCKRINAPFNPTCFCEPPTPPKDGLARLTDEIRIRREFSKQIQQNFAHEICLVCGGYHGKNIQCVYLVAQ